MRIGTTTNSLFMDGGTSKCGRGRDFTASWKSTPVHVLLAYHSCDVRIAVTWPCKKAKKENTGKRLEGNILLMTRHCIGSKKKNIVIVILMLTNITINRSYSIGSTSQLRSIIIFADCPVFWQSKLQTETTLSTIEAKFIALSACCRELFPIIGHG